jgi:hypothetical protein
VCSLAQLGRDLSTGAMWLICLPATLHVIIPMTGSAAGCQRATNTLG